MLCVASRSLGGCGFWSHFYCCVIPVKLQSCIRSSWCICKRTEHQLMKNRARLFEGISFSCQLFMLHERNYFVLSLLLLLVTQQGMYQFRVQLLYVAKPLLSICHFFLPSCWSSKVFISNLHAEMMKLVACLNDLLQICWIFDLKQVLVNFMYIQQYYVLEILFMGIWSHQLDCLTPGKLEAMWL